MTVTVSTLAKDLSLSRRSIAFVPGDRPHLFREETQQHVFSAAETLGYRRNTAAVNNSNSNQVFVDDVAFPPNAGPSLTVRTGVTGGKKRGTHISILNGLQNSFLWQSDFLQRTSKRRPNADVN